MNNLAKTLDMDDAKVNIKSINDHVISSYIQTDIKTHLCSNCNAWTSKVHDYRIQKIRDSLLQGKPCFLFLKSIISSDKYIGILKMYEREFKKECCLLLGSTTNKVRA